MQCTSDFQHPSRQPASNSTSLFARVLAKFLARQKERARHAAAENKALGQYDELLSMPDYMLADIGLTRDIVRQERTRLLYTRNLDLFDFRHPR